MTIATVVQRQKRAMAVTAAAVAAVTLCAACSSSGGGNGATSGSQAPAAASQAAASTAPSTSSGSSSGISASAAAFFKGKTLSIIVPYGPGGGYDQWARLLAPYFKQYLGLGKVTVVNQAGGGGIIGTNKIYTAKPDGLTIGDTNAGGDLFDAMDHASGFNVDMTKINWIGRPDNDPHIIATRLDSKYKTFDDLVNSKSTIKALATGKGSSDYNAAVIIYNAFKVPFQMVAAFSGSTQEKAAFLSGEGDTSSVSSSDIAQISNKAQPVVIVSPTTFPKLPKTPTVLQEAQSHNLSASTVQALTALGNVMQTGHAFVAPPGIPADRLSALQAAFKDALNNPSLLAAANKGGLYPGYRSPQDLTSDAATALKEASLFTNLLKTP